MGWLFAKFCVLKYVRTCMYVCTYVRMCMYVLCIIRMYVFMFTYVYKNAYCIIM
jgi:hypothetical protein